MGFYKSSVSYIPLCQAQKAFIQVEINIYIIKDIECKHEINNDKNTLPVVYLSDCFLNESNLLNHYTATDDCRFVYLIRNELTTFCKIGITNNPKKRMAQLQNSSGMNLQMLLYIQLEPDYDENASYIESYLHKFFKHKKIFGEWFNLSIKDIISIRNLFFDIYGEDVKDNIKKYLLKNVR